MSADLGRYAFLPWLRQGISTQVNRLADAPAAGRATVSVTVEITGGTESTPIPVQIGLLGPGDVKAFDTRAIIRHWPRPDVFEVEPNYFPLLELFPGDVAWRYTPARPDSANAGTKDRLPPWLGLIALRDDEIDTIDSPTADRPNPQLTVKPGAPLPRVDQLWAWAHLHVDGMDATTPDQVQTLLDNASHQIVARLLCPRRLDQRTAYTAFLVPTLEAARCAALGLAVDPTLDLLTPAWTNEGSVSVELPVFYQWRFQTSETGDFESLARRIVAEPLPPSVGQRPMDVSHPGLVPTPAASTPLAVESALQALEAAPSPWDPTERQTWTTALAGLVDLPEQRMQVPGRPRTLAPPLYGRWYAATGTLDPNASPPWFQDLNADPRTRVAAALGWQVVQNEQQQLLAGAWAQVDAIRDANTALRLAQLAREAATRIYQRHVLVRPQPAITLFTAPLHPRILVPTATTPLTVGALIAQSPLRAGVLHPAFHRIARPRGPVRLRQGRPPGLAPITVLDRVNTGELPIAPPPVTPAQLPTMGGAGPGIAPLWLTPDIADWLAQLPYPTWQHVDTVLSLTQAQYPQFLVPDQRQQLLDFLTQIQQAVNNGATPGDEIRRRLAARDGALTPQQIKSAPAQIGFAAQELDTNGNLPPLTPPLIALEDTRFRDAAATAFGDVNAAPTPGELLHPIDLPTIGGILTGTVDPRTTIGATFAHRVGVLPPWHPPDPLEPVMAAPTFAQPLYQPLRDLSPEWLLAGLGELPQDVASVAQPNERFIESFLVGANDEMGRTLLFNEYPTDQRGTYFNQFWDNRTSTTPTPDIPPIAGWPTTAALGANSTHPGTDPYLVLVVRAELLRRYPNTLVYAVQAQWLSDGTRRVPPQDPVERHPVFTGTVGTGAGFWGFALTTVEARGASTPAQGAAGWYFALQEHSSEPRFGLEPAATDAAKYAGSPATWQELAWSDLAADAAALDNINYVDLSAALPHVDHVADRSTADWHVSDGTHAAALACITYREPARLLVHASRMIPTTA